MVRRVDGRSSLVVVVVMTAIVLALLLVPVYGALLDDAYVLSFASRILVFALAAVGLNLALGYGGLVSFGHALYLGLGAYTVAVLNSLDVHSGWLHLLGVVVVVAAISAAVGWVALRTRGIAFIMITLAFAQLFFFLFVSFKGLGGDEGITLRDPSAFGALTGNRVTLYYALLACVGAAVYGTRRLVNSRFGLVLRATRVNERRVRAVGTGTFAYLLTAYVLSALVVGVAGFFLANLSGFVSPAYMAWTVSGELIVMVVLGGVGTAAGPVVGAAVLLAMEEALKAWTEYPMMILGPMIIAMVLAFRGGFWGMLPRAHEARSAGPRPLSEPGPKIARETQ